MPRDIAERLAVTGGDRVLLVVDDLQWADQATLALLGHVVRGPLSSRLAVIAAYREDQAEAHLYGALGDLRRDCEIDRIELDGLGVADVAALIGGAFETSAAAAQARAIHDRTGGNPFYVRELARHVAERPGRRSATSRRGFGTSCAPGSSGCRTAAPTRWREPRSSARCSTPPRSRPSRGPTRSRLRRSTRQSRPACSTRLAPAVTASPTRLTRDAIYAGLSASRRARLHRGAAEVLAERHGEEPGPRLAEIACTDARVRRRAATSTAPSSWRRRRRDGRQSRAPTARR